MLGLHTPYYFLSKAWRTTKLGVATTLTLVSAGILLYGVFTVGGLFNVIMGAIGLAGSAIIFVDSSKVHNDVAKAMEKNEELTRDYRETADELHQQTSDFRDENVALQRNVFSLGKSLKEAVKHTQALQKIKSKLEITASSLEQDIEDNRIQVFKLAQHVDELSDIRQELTTERNELEISVKKADEQTKSLQVLYETALASDQAHQVQIEKLKLIVESSQKVLLAVANVGDQFDQFSTTIDTQLINMENQNDSLENTAHVMDVLLNQLQDKTFDDLDENKDGVVTADEFDNILKKQKENKQLEE